jgi:hypothetical protein
MARGRNRTCPSLPSKFVQEKYDMWTERIGKLQDALDAWKTDEMALSEARTHTASLNSGIRSMSIDPDGTLTKRQGVRSIVIQTLNTILGRKATEEEITKLVNQMEEESHKAEEEEVEA